METHYSVLRTDKLFLSDILSSFLSTLIKFENALIDEYMNFCHIIFKEKKEPSHHIFVMSNDISLLVISEYANSQI